MNIADVVALARAGFTADQIARMYATPAPVVQAQTVPAAQVQTAPVVQAQTVPAAQVQTAPVVQAQTVPAAPVQTAPVVQAQTVPAAQVQTAPDNNSVMEQLKLLTNTLQANAILNSNQPKQESVEDILASIINPTKAN